MAQDKAANGEMAGARARVSGRPAPSGKAPCAADVHQDYLRVVGERVRRARTRRGMTRKILARDSGVSERYLAQLESGQGNISIGLLRQVAQAISLPVQDLVREGSDRPVEVTAIVRRLEQMSLDDLAEARRLLADRFGFYGDDARQRRVALIGLRGAGKTTLGRGLAAARSVPFVEMANEIEAVSGMSLDKIFDLQGQAGYRRYEKRALENVIDRHHDCVIAAGGSLVSEPQTFDFLLSKCFTVWIQASPEEHMARVVAQGDMRPMAGSREAMADLKQILEDRHTLYSKADAVLDTSGQDVEAAITELRLLVQPQAPSRP